MGLSDGWKGVAQAGGLAVLLGAIVVGGVFAVQGPSALQVKEPEPVVTEEHAAARALAEKVRYGPITEAERGQVEEALNYRFPQGSRVAAGSVEFYFDGGATACGTVQPKGRAAERFIYRNSFVVAEGDQSAADFQMFWRICEAGGA